MKLILTLLLFALPALSAPVQGELFVSTEPVETSQGQFHLEVQTFEINNVPDLKRVQQQIAEKTEAAPTKEFFHLEVSAQGHQRSEVEHLAHDVLVGIESQIEAETRLAPAPVEVEPAKGFFAKHYNLTLSLVRGISNGSVVTTGLIVGMGIPLEHAGMIGLLAGTLSGGVQYKSQAILKWLKNSVLLVNAAKKLGLIPKTEAPGVTEQALVQVETYGRWTMLEGGFLLIIRTAMAMMGIASSEHLLETLGKSVGSQGVYEVGVMKASEQLAAINPRWAGKAVVFQNVALFAGSGISVLSAIGSMIGMPFANLGFVTLTASGIVLNFSPKLARSQPVEKLLMLMKISKPRCAYLFQMVK